MMKKIYTDDPLVKYATTDKTIEYTKMDINSVLGQYEVADVAWHFDPEGKKGIPSIYVLFTLDERFNEMNLTVPVRIDCPTIWDKEQKKRRPFREEQINWKVSMRAMYHFIYNSLNNSYAMQSSSTVGFLGYIQTANKIQLKDVLLPRINAGNALEFKEQSQPPKFVEQAQLEPEVIVEDSQVYALN